MIKIIVQPSPFGLKMISYVWFDQKRIQRWKCKIGKGKRNNHDHGKKMKKTQNYDVTPVNKKERLTRNTIHSCETLIHMFYNN
jgi:hypothetical protein